MLKAVASESPGELGNMTGQGWPYEKELNVVGKRKGKVETVNISTSISQQM